VPAEVAQAIAVSAFGGFLVAQQAAKRMLPHKHGAILFTGASASVKGYPQSAPFAMGKFAQRGLAQSMARELSPQGIHVAHFVIDGGIRSAARTEPADRPDSMLDPTHCVELLERAATAAPAPGPGNLNCGPGREVLRYHRHSRTTRSIEPGMTGPMDVGNSDMMTDITIDTGTNELLCAIRDRVAVITLNRPEVRNALSDDLTPRCAA